MRRARLVLLPILIALLLLEAILQAGAAVVYWTARTPELPAQAGDGPTILCVGDSFTYGLGSSSAENTYPAALRSALQEHLDAPPRVVNAGWPSQNSRDVLTRLDGQLTRFRPRLVFILVGLNDTWSKPELLELDPAQINASGEAEPGWRWRWRTARLVRLILAGRAESAATFTVASPEDESPAPLPTAQTTDDERDSDFDRAVSLFRQGNAPGAIELFRQAMETAPEKTPECYQGLVQAHTLLGQSEPAREALAWLEAEWEQRPRRPVAEAFAVSLAVAGDAEPAAQVAREALERFPESSSLWWLLGEDDYRNGDLQAAESAYDRAIETASADDPVWHALVMRACARACAERDPGKAIDLIVRSLMTDRDFGRCRIIAEGAKRHFTPELVRRRLAVASLAGPDLELAQRLFAEVLVQERSAECDVLGDHLRQMIDRCRAHGALPVLLTYPFPIPDIEAVQTEIARSMEVELVPIRRRFEAELRRRSREELFIPDGHCSDAGYALMGQAAAEIALKLLDG